MVTSLPVLVAVMLAARTALAAPAAFDAHAEAQRLAGQAIYRDGLLASGKPLAGTASGGMLRQGRGAACVACHRRSGFGIAEGDVVVRPITAADLFRQGPAEAADARIAHQLGTRRRPAYDDAALATALRTGIDVTGRRLHSMMPRYALGDADMAALQRYLKSLFAEPDAGVDAQDIHLATVIQPGVAPARSLAMLDVLRAFVRDKNAGVRSEVARRRGGAMRMHRSYRRWVLDVWELDGAPDGWRAQLEERYRRQPVFAMVSGIGEFSWQPIHDFSEHFRVPCILPLTSLSGTGSSFYTVYFSRGVALGFTYPWAPPELRSARVRRSTDWLQARHIAGDQLQLQVNTHFAISMVGEALAHLMDSFSRDYFIETIEHNLTTTLLSSFVPAADLIVP